MKIPDLQHVFVYTIALHLLWELQQTVKHYVVCTHQVQEFCL